MKIMKFRLKYKVKFKIEPGTRFQIWDNMRNIWTLQEIKEIVPSEEIYGRTEAGIKFVGIDRGFLYEADFLIREFILPQSNYRYLGKDDETINYKHTHIRNKETM